MRDRDGVRERETGRETVDGARKRVLQHATFTKRQTSMLFSMQGRTTERGSPTFSRPELSSLSLSPSPPAPFRLQIKTVHVVCRSESRPRYFFDNVGHDLAETNVTNVISPGDTNAIHARARVYIHELSKLTVDVDRLYH